MDAMFLNMVSERYPREEDDDASASDSAFDEDDDSVSDEVLTVSAPILETSSSHCIRFGSFDSPIIPVSNPSIKPEFDGFSIKIGEISCVLTDSCKSIVDDDDSAHAALQDDEKQKVLESQLQNRDSEFVHFEAPEVLVTVLPVRLCSTVYGVAASRSLALWFFAGKQTEPIVSAVNNQVWSFQLHDESIVDFDPGGRVFFCSLFSVLIVLRQLHFRLWWIPWDRGKQPSRSWLTFIRSCFWRSMFGKATFCNSLIHGTAFSMQQIKEIKTHVS